MLFREKSGAFRVLLRRQRRDPCHFVRESDENADRTFDALSLARRFRVLRSLSLFRGFRAHCRSVMDAAIAVDARKEVADTGRMSTTRLRSIAEVERRAIEHVKQRREDQLGVYCGRFFLASSRLELGFF